jgi:hypothetical protein
MLMRGDVYANSHPLHQHIARFGEFENKRWLSLASGAYDDSTVTACTVTVVPDLVTADTLLPQIARPAPPS